MTGRYEMDLIANFFGWLAMAYFASIPFIWMWVFYHKIKCRKINKCSNRKCKYWQYCRHNYVERKKDELELRRQILLHRLGLEEEELDKESP